MKRTITAVFAVLALTFGAQGAYAAPNNPGDTPGKSPYHKTHGEEASHGKPCKGGGKGLGHCKHSPGRLNGSTATVPVTTATTTTTTTTTATATTATATRTVTATGSGQHWRLSDQGDPALCTSWSGVTLRLVYERPPSAGGVGASLRGFTGGRHVSLQLLLGRHAPQRVDLAPPSGRRRNRTRADGGCPGRRPARTPGTPGEVSSPVAIGLTGPLADDLRARAMSASTTSTRKRPANSRTHWASVMMPPISPIGLPHGSARPTRVRRTSPPFQSEARPRDQGRVYVRGKPLTRGQRQLLWGGTCSAHQFAAASSRPSGPRPSPSSPVSP